MTRRVGRAPRRSWHRAAAAGGLLTILSCGPSGSERSDTSEAGTDSGTTQEVLRYDLLIHDGTVVDGTGEPRRRADVLVRDGLVVHVGGVDPDTLVVTETFDATGLIVAPGFVDAHAHGDPTETPDFQNFLAQGVTTIVLGQDGSGPDPGSFSATLDAADAANPALNVAYLVGHNTVRRASGVDFADPDAAGLERMRSLVEEALAAGAFGLSTGLEYTPGNQAGIEELAAVARPVAAVDGVVMSHLRSEDADRIDASVAELLEQGRRSGARVHVSHMKIVLEDDPSAAERVLAMLDAARAEGVRVTADVYPYTASFTGISILFPDWARGPTPYADVVRDRRPELEEHLRARVGARNGPEATLFGSGPWSGLTLAEAAAREGRPFEDLLVELGPGGASAAYFVMDEDVMTRFLTHPHVAVSSDGSPTMSHPRGYGSVARVLGTFAGESAILSLEEAVRKMSSLPASILGLDDPSRVAVPRGLLREGWAADLAVFNAAEIRDRADFEAPHTLAAGMRAVWVGGEPAWMDGAPTDGPRNGRVLRRR
jgi:N-acyl-D-amino-acid deacylase